MDLLTDLLPFLTGSPLLPVIVVALCLIDGFFPPVPSEMTVVAALSTVMAASGSWQWAILICVAALLGAVAGDSIAFALGRRWGTGAGWLRRPRMRRATEHLIARAHRSPATVILVGRFIPVGRVAVNLVAGASGLRYRRFLALSVAGCAAWVAMCAVIAAVSATWLGNPLWSALLGIAMMAVVGLVVDRAVQRRERAVAR